MKNVKLTAMKALVLLLVITALGSVCAFYGVNLLLSDVSNMFYMTITKDVISSLPIVIIALQFVLAAVATMRLYRKPEYKKAEARCYSCILLGLAVLGLIMSILTGTIIYKSFTAPYPFPGATIGELIWHAVAILIAIILLIWIKEWPDDTEKREITVRHILNSIFLVLIFFLAMNRVGALLFLAGYLHVPTFWMTFWFYLFQLLPFILVLQMALHYFGIYDKQKKLGIVLAASVLVGDIVLMGVIVNFAFRYPEFISAVSPAVGLERLIAMPIDTIFFFVLVLVMSIYMLWISIRYQKKRKKKKLESA